MFRFSLCACTSDIAPAMTNTNNEHMCTDEMCSLGNDDITSGAIRDNDDVTSDAKRHGDYVIPLPYRTVMTSLTLLYGTAIAT